MKAIRAVLSILFAILYLLISNSWIIVRQKPLLLLAVLPLFLVINILAGAPYNKLTGKRLKCEQHGVECLKIFLFGTAASAAYHIWLGINFWSSDKKLFFISLIWCFVFLTVIFWNGITFVYCTSVQLGIKIRAIGLIFGWIFPINVVVLFYIIGRCNREVNFETDKIILNESRKNDLICKTKYPILMVHGVFFRDFKMLDYWGRIPNELKKNGAVIYYGEHQSAASVENSARELTERIKKIVEETGCEKINIIAHSKGGLDCRCAIASGAGEYIASLTTINTPHRGCGFADYLLEKVPDTVQKKVETGYNAAAKIAGDKTPDFMAAVKDLTAERCKVMDREMKAPEGIYCQSVGSQLVKARGGKFPMNFSYGLVKLFDGPNDGLVAQDSFEWGEKFTYLTPKGNRGISHGDMIDLNRENIKGFDVREFYVQIVSDLREKGL